MIKVGQKYIFNGSEDDPNNGDTITVTGQAPFSVALVEDEFMSFAFESELSNVSDTDAEI